MELQKHTQHDNKLSFTRLSISDEGKLFQRQSKYRPGYMNQVMSYTLFMMSLAALIAALSGSYSVSKTYVLLNIAAYSCVIAIMLESKTNETRGYMIILLMSVFNCLVIIMAILKIF